MTSYNSKNHEFCSLLQNQFGLCSRTIIQKTHWQVQNSIPVLESGVKQPPLTQNAVHQQKIEKRGSKVELKCTK